MVDGLAPISHGFREPKLKRGTTSSRLRHIGDRHEAGLRNMREYRADRTVRERMGHAHEAGTDQRHAEIFHTRNFQTKGWASRLCQAPRLTTGASNTSLGQRLQVYARPRKCN